MLTEEDAKNIILNTRLPDGDRGLSQKLAALTKSERLKIIRSDEDERKRRISATIEIQRWYRGYKTRCWFERILVSDLGTEEIDDDDDDIPISEKQNGQGSKELNLKVLYEAYCEASRRGGKEPASYASFMSSYQDHLDKESRTDLVSKKSRHSPPTPAEAAEIIQRAWRRHIDIQVFRYYRDLINFRQRGDPRLMLKCINPKEAELLDAAAGIHIKFRLAGERFPPNIYYKIFTHRGIVDMCANSPKDYTHPSCKRKEMRDLHNKNNRNNQYQNRVNWYERWENNGWRLVSDRLIQHVTVDPVTWDTAHARVKFHHDKLQRRQDVEKRRRLKKIKWMRQMYREGMMKTRVTDQETIELIEGAAAGMVAAVEKEGPEAVQEWEVDELLEWTTTLSFDEYMDTWKGIATSAKSEAMIEKKNLESYRQYLEMQSLKAYQSETRARLLTSFDGDPYMFSVTGGSQHQNGASVQPPFHTPSVASGPA